MDCQSDSIDPFQAGVLRILVAGPLNWIPGTLTVPDTSLDRSASTW